MNISTFENIMENIFRIAFNGVVWIIQLSTQLSMKFQQPIKTKKHKVFIAFRLSDAVFIMLINVKMSTTENDMWQN